MDARSNKKGEERKEEMFNLKAIYQGLYGGRPRAVCEVGVNQPALCSLTEFINDGVPAILVEPLPWHAKALCKAFPGATVREIVCGDSNGTVRLYDRGEGSWIEHVPEGTAPDEHEKHSAMKRGVFESRFIRDAQSVTFDQIDPGNLDILCVDTEGAEWFVIKRMVSRPRLVRVETHWICSGWKNPFLSEIEAYMKNAGYIVLAQDVSDTIWALLL